MIWVIEGSVVVGEGGAGEMGDRRNGGSREQGVFHYRGVHVISLLDEKRVVGSTGRWCPHLIGNIFQLVREGLQSSYA